MQLKTKHSFIASCALHGLCFLLFAGLIFNHRQKPLDNGVKPETVIDIAFVSDTKPQDKQQPIKQLLQKPVQKIAQKIVQKQTTIKPVSPPKKVMAAQQPSPILPVKIADIQAKPLSQFKPVIYHTDNAFAKPVSVTHDTNATSKAKDTKNNITTKTPPATHQANNFNKDNYIAYVKGQIAKHKFYPISAKRRGIEGRVGLKISIKPTGDILSLHIISSSGSDILDKSAIESVHAAAPFKQATQMVSFSFGINYYLE
jgi:periplasmic protein TonB